MGLFNLFKKNAPEKKLKSVTIKVLQNEKITADGSRIHFDVPAELSTNFQFIPGQYLNIHIENGGKKHVRSYSICSGINEPLAIGVKAVENGLVSNYLVNQIKAGDSIQVDFPMGNFKLTDDLKSIVCFAAGSGITPFMSFAKSLKSDQKMRLFFGNATKESTFFLSDLSTMTNPSTTFTYTKAVYEDTRSGRLDKKLVSELIKEELSLLRADGFFICGPEEMILSIQEVLLVFGVPKEKIHFELFTTPVLIKAESKLDSSNTFKGVSQVSAILDGDIQRIELKSEGASILDALINSGMDAPYSCKGGVCCTCKAKIIEGSAKMDINYSLTDQEVQDGYILTCQAHPTSEVLKIDYDV